MRWDRYPSAEVAETGDGYLLRLDGAADAGLRKLCRTTDSVVAFAGGSSHSCHTVLGFAIVIATAQLGIGFGLIEAVALSWCSEQGAIRVMFWLSAVGMSLAGRSWSSQRSPLLLRLGMRTRNRIVPPVRLHQGLAIRDKCRNQGRSGWVAAARFLLIIFFLAQVVFAVLMSVGRPLQCWIAGSTGASRAASSSGGWGHICAVCGRLADGNASRLPAAVAASTIVALWLAGGTR